MGAKERLEQNRKEIDMLLNADLPLDLLYKRMRIIEAENKVLISKS